MNLFEHLPEDIQKIVSFYLTVEEIEKIPSNFTNPNSTLWKAKTENLLDMKVNYKLLYLIAEKIKQDKIAEVYFNLGVHEQYLSKVKWESLNIDIFIKNDIFLNKYIDVCDKKGDTLLTHVCSMSSKSSNDKCNTYIKYVEKLIRYGANVNHQSSKDLWSPLMAALQHDNPIFTIVRMLLDADAKVSLKNKRGDTALSILEPGKRFYDVNLLCEEVLKRYL